MKFSEQVLLSIEASAYEGAAFKVGRYKIT